MLQIERNDAGTRPVSSTTHPVGSRATPAVDNRHGWQRVAQSAKMQSVAASTEPPPADARAAIADAFAAFARTGDATKAHAVLGRTWDLERMKARELREEVSAYYARNGLGDVGWFTMKGFERQRAEGSIVKGRVAFEHLCGELAGLSTIADAPSVYERLRDYRFTMFQSGVSSWTINRAIAAAESIIAGEMVRLGRASLEDPALDARAVTAAAAAVTKFGPLTGLSKAEVRAILAPASGRISGALNERVQGFTVAPHGLLDRWLNGGPAKMNALYKELKNAAPDRDVLKHDLNTALRERYANTAIDILTSVRDGLARPDPKEDPMIARSAAAFRVYFARVYAAKAKLRPFGDGPSREKLATITGLQDEVDAKIGTAALSFGAFMAAGFHLLGIVLHPFTHVGS